MSAMTVYAVGDGTFSRKTDVDAIQLQHELAVATGLAGGFTAVPWLLCTCGGCTVADN